MNSCIVKLLNNSMNGKSVVIGNLLSFVVQDKLENRG